VSLDAVRAFHADVYGGASLVMVLVGAVDAQAACQSFQRLFGDWAGGQRWQAPERLQPGPTGPPALELLRDKASVDVHLGHAGTLRPGDPDHLALTAANRILGYSTIASRLGLRLRDTEGLTYG